MQCWGSNDEGELIIPAAASSLSQISTGYFHTCVLRSDNVPLCWGRNDDGQSNVPNALKLSDKLQFIDFNPAPNPATVGTFFTVSATGGASGNPVTFSSLTPSICTTSGAQVQLVALGVCSIAANQAGSGDYIDAQQVVLNVDVTSSTDFLSRCGHAITGIAFDGTSYFVGEGHNSLDQCVSRYSPTGALLETKHFQVDIRGLHYLPASGLLTSRTWGGPIYSLNYSAGTQQSFTGFDAVPGIEQSQPAADPDGTSFWILDVPGQTAQRRSVANDTLIASFRITGGLASAPAIAVSNALVFVPNGLSVIAYDKVSGEVVDTIQVPSSTEGCSGYGFGASTAGDRIMYSSACNIAHVKLITPVRTQSISFTSSVPNPAFVGSTYIVTATGGASGNPIVFTASPDSVCTVSGNTVTMVSAGDCTVVAHQAGGNNYLRAPNQTQRFAITKMSQSISFTSTPSTPTFSGSYVVAATGGGSGNPVVFSSTTPSTCTVAGAAVSFVGAGSCTIAANQGGNATYDAAPVATQSFSIAKASQVISFTSVPPSPARLDGSYTPVASSQAGLPVVFSATGSCSVNGATVVMTSVGQCIVQATANGNANYLSGSTTQSFNVFYLFTGFASPIVNAPAVNAAKAGSGIKIQFSRAGNRGLNVIASGSPVSGLLAGACNVAGSPTAVTQAIPAIDLRYDPTTDQYAYSWQTDAAWAGTCRQFSMLLSDGSVHLAHFQFDVAKKPSVVLTVSPTNATAGIQSSHTFTIDIVSPTAIQGITGIPCALPAIASGALTYKQSCIMTTKFATAGSPTYTAQVALQGQPSPTLSNAVSINVATPPAPVLTYSANPTTVQVGVAATITYSFSITSATVITGVLSSGCVIPPPAPGLTSYSGTCTTTVTYPKTGKTGYIVSASVEGRSGYTSSNTVTITVTK
jgi:hypothetical protein